ncbi:hypothetical protein FRC20_004892, partial [Serendipita sp. 405]
MSMALNKEKWSAMSVLPMLQDILSFLMNSLSLSCINAQACNMLDYGIFWIGNYDWKIGSFERRSEEQSDERRHSS